MNVNTTNFLKFFLKKVEEYKNNITTHVWDCPSFKFFIICSSCPLSSVCKNGSFKNVSIRASLAKKLLEPIQLELFDEPK